MVDSQEITVTTSQGKVFGLQGGNAEDHLVLGLHGWSQRNGWHTWESMLTPLTSAGFRVVLVDMPGWGRSPKWEGQPLQPVQRATGIVFDLMEALGATSASLMGKSWGGGVALAAALQRPSKIEKLILTAPAFNPIEALSSLVQPVLLAWAEDDPMISYGCAAEYVRHIPSCQLVSYGSGGHSAAQRNVADFGPKAVAFLRSGIQTQPGSQV